MLRDRADRVWDVLSIDVIDGRIEAIRIVRNPDKLRHLRPMSHGGGLARQPFMTDTTTHSAHLVRAAAGEVLDGDPGSVITLLADPDATGGLLTSNRSLLRAGSDGAPPHYHRLSAELFFVLDGRLTVLLDDDIVTLERGDLLVVPPGMPHAFAPAADTDADVLFVFTPGTARFEYFRLLDMAHRGEADRDLIAESQDRFDNHYVDSPAWRAAISSTGSSSTA